MEALRLGFEPVAREKKLALRIESAPDAPANFVTDSQRLQQVLKNLLSNALKFTERGEVSLSIGVEERKDRELLLRSMQYSIERKRYQEELERQANYDTLTGLPNRHLLNDRLKQAVSSQRHVRSVAVVFIDLDHFKVINDSLGHNFGDDVLRHVAERLLAAVRDGDTVARLGGDEFVLILDEQSREDVIFRTMRRIIGRVSEPMMVGDRELNITCSAGISLYPQDGPDVQTLLKNADTAMFHGKSLGKNTYQFFTQQMNIAVKRRMLLETALRRAVMLKSFALHYQPQINLDTGEFVGVEALVRWRSEDGTTLLPGDFIAVAEETGLINEMGEWVLREGCRQAKAWRDQGMPPLRMAINLSARQFLGRDLVEQVKHALKQTGLEARYLELEITESVAMHSAENTLRTLKELKALGVRIAIDDFGTGYSSLGYLKRFPVDTLKIDRSFVKGIGGNVEDSAIVRAVITVAKSLNLSVTAEGIETAEQLEHLRALGCDHGQGYYFAKPMASDRVPALLMATAPWGAATATNGHAANGHA